MGKKAKEKGKEGNKLALKAAAGTVLLVLLAVAIYIVADMAVSFRHIDSRAEARGIMEQQFLLMVIISLVMFLLSIYLMYIYLKDYLALKSGFTLGLLLLMFSFMMFSIGMNPWLQLLLGVYGRVGLFSFIPFGLATLSLVILAWISSK